MRMLLTMAFVVCLVLAHDTWLLPLLESGLKSSLLTGSRFPESDTATSPHRVKSWSVVSTLGATPFESVHMGDNRLDAMFRTDTRPSIVEAALHPHEIDLVREDFKSYLRDEDSPCARDCLRQLSPDLKNVREVYSKHCKALLLRDQLTSKPVGHPLELVTDELSAFVLLGSGKPLEHHPVKAHHELGRTVSFVTDEFGKFFPDLDLPGAWLLRSHVIWPSSKAGVDYESQWCSLTLTQ